MKNFRPQIVIISALLAAIVSETKATSEYDYKPGEFLVIKGGRSPDKKFSIVSGDNKFGIYLMEAQTKK